jgi:hypothetical protein
MALYGVIERSSGRTSYARIKMGRRDISSSFQFIPPASRTDQVAKLIYTDVESKRKLTLDSMFMLRAGILQKLALKDNAYYLDHEKWDDIMLLPEIVGDKQILVHFIGNEM